MRLKSTARRLLTSFCMPVLVALIYWLSETEWIEKDLNSHTELLI
ncbi:Uncharacterized protein BM_BM13109 [Brugia malayi]|uniref:Bm13109 n=1 Tax=Brugia malayi TaxID=6279 RepID=A0A0J9XV56_BRUMA|nr:Uncharacterized protein BM_BM13109 [Brugia malayi]CDP96354.1 Bm13109 [Brugia malayi]VIO98378.1 Uncharacterized protein BM_BM13109 [Brugia malayi]